MSERDSDSNSSVSDSAASLSHCSRRLRLLLCLCALLPALTGCYLMQAAAGQMEVARKRQPIAEVIASPSTPAPLKTRLEYVSAAREFAIRELALPDNDSYRSYADVGRPFVVWNVFAAERFSVEPRRWCFPIVGCVVYRGYFDEASAQKYARRLRLNGYDTAVGGVAAYSTLGHFKDPVLNTMLGWGDAQLAATLFHELAHQVLYVPGDSDFNEAFATVVEEAGIDRWLHARGLLDNLKAWRTYRQRSARFVGLLLDTRARLAELYASTLSEVEKADRKQLEFARLKLDYERIKRDEWNGYSGYDHWFARTLNNAHLVSAATYHACVPALTQVLRSVDNDLPRFYEKVKALSDDRRWREQLCAAAEPGARSEDRSFHGDTGITG